MITIEINPDYYEVDGEGNLVWTTESIFKNVSSDVKNFRLIIGTRGGMAGNDRDIQIGVLSPYSMADSTLHTILNVYRQQDFLTQILFEMSRGAIIVKQDGVTMTESDVAGFTIVAP